MLWTIIALIASYLLGSLPTAYIFGKILKGIDIRKVGSGNVGATNAMRALGRGPGIIVLLLDIFKGFVAVIFIGDYFSGKPVLWQEQNLRIIMGLCCICGHNWTVFLRFKGGKGIATSFGVLLGLALKIEGLGIVIGILIATWLLVFIIWRIVSLASIVSAIILPASFIFFKQPFLLVVVSIILCIFVLIRHKSNLIRLFKGKEERLRF